MKNPQRLHSLVQGRRRRSAVHIAVLIALGILGFSSSAMAQYKITWDDFNRTEPQCTNVCVSIRYVQTCYPPTTPTAPPFCTVVAECAAWAPQCVPVRKRLPDSDLIDVRIEKNAVDPSIVLFVLETPKKITWYKGITVPDGGGSRWTIYNADPDQWNPDPKLRKQPRKHDEVSLWAHQVLNGQCLTFTKAGFLGYWKNSYTLCDLDRLQPGSKVTFNWVSD